MALIKDSEHLRIPFKDIEIATKNFTTLIGKGGFGNVYKGELSLFGILTTVAVKRLDASISGQGFKEFLTEIHVLSRYKHPNLVSLHGFCQDGNENILVYEHADHGSLDKFLYMDSKVCPLTCKQKIDICIDAACGLDYLHNHIAKNKRVIHRDIKSANILINHNWKGMVSDLGLSKIGLANENDTFVITNACGTHAYCDPVYMDTGVLTKESDVYSFGVVLFEVLCGRPCFLNVNNEQRFLAALARHYYEEGKVHEIIDPVMKEQLHSGSLIKISEIAYQCLHIDREKRPTIASVVKKLKQALEVQDFIKDQVANIYVSPKVLDVPASDVATSSKVLESSGPTLGMKRPWPVGILHVLVIKAMKLQKKDLSGAADPYVKLNVTNGKYASKMTTVKHKNLNPEWNEEFNLIVKDPEVQALVIMVFDWDSEIKQDKIGMNKLPLKDFTPEEPKTLTLDLLMNMDPNDTENKKSHGQIVVELTYKPFDEQEVTWADGGGLLVVKIHGGTHLSEKNHTNPSVWIVFGGEKKRTQYIKHDPDPTWEEEFTFVSKDTPVKENLHLEVVSISKRMGLISTKESLGYIDIPLADVVENKQIREKYYLNDSKKGVLEVEMQWRALV